jgi:hypothetical protein
MRFAEVGDDVLALVAEDEEVWAPVADCAGRYFVSTFGRVASRVRGGHTTKMLTPSISLTGYLTVGVTASPGGKSDTRLVHRLVVAAFVGSQPSELHIDIRHLDGNKQNNRVDNLRWGTRSENMKDVYAHRAPAMRQRVLERRETKWYSEDEHLRDVAVAFYREGKLTIADCARLMDCSAERAAQIVHGETQRTMTGPTTPRKRYRTPQRKQEIMALVGEGRNLKDINEALGEVLTAQDLYYYRTRLRRPTS